MSLICIEGQCLKGESAVTTLRGFFASLGSPQEYWPAVDAIGSRFDALNSSWSRSLPFSPACCEIEQLGNEADALRGQLASRYGAADVPVDDRKSPIDAIGNGLDTAIKLALVAVIAFIGYQALVVSKGVSS